MDDQQAVISVGDVSKSFKLPYEKNSTIKGSVVNFWRQKRGYELFEALNDVSFQVKKGEFFGIVGRNGSGKSTLLKVLAGIYSPTEGSIQVNGKLIPFIELGVGFSPELSGRDNVYLNGSLLGFNHKEMDKLYKDIVAFAELEKFMDQKLKNYSSGMQVRLAFSIAIRAQSDILVLDEVLAVGDEAFQQKCLKIFENYRALKKTVILVTHDMDTVRKFCTRVIMLDKGKIISEGNPTVVANDYLKINQEATSESITKENLSRKKQSKTKVTLSGATNNNTFAPGDKLTVKVDYSKIGKQVKGVGVAVFKTTGEYIYGTNTFIEKIVLSKGAKNISYDLSLNIGAGNYVVNVGVFGKDEDEVLEYVEFGPQFSIKTNKQKWQGIVNLEHKWEKV